LDTEEAKAKLAKYDLCVCLEFSESYKWVVSGTQAMTIQRKMTMTDCHPSDARHC